MAAWEVWNLRNSVIFNNGVASPQLWARKFKCLDHLQPVRVCEDKRAYFIYFLDIGSFKMSTPIVNILFKKNK
jgi:hypothetical protein